MNLDPRGVDPFDHEEPSLRWPWVVAPVVAGATVLVMVVLAALLHAGHRPPPAAAASVLATRASIGSASPLIAQPSTSPIASCQRASDVGLRAGTPSPHGGWITLAARSGGRWTRHLCPGERVRVYWASYTLDVHGDGMLYRSQVGWLDADHPSARFFVVVPEACQTWFAGAGTAGIPAVYQHGWAPSPGLLVTGYLPGRCG